MGVSVRVVLATRVAPLVAGLGVLAVGCQAIDAGEGARGATPSTRLTLEPFERGGVACYRLLDSQADSDEPVVEGCPESDSSADEIAFEAAGPLDGGPDYLVLSIPPAAELLETSGPSTRNGRWLAIEGTEPTGSFWLRAVNLGGEVYCTVTMPIHLECDLIRIVE